MALFCLHLEGKSKQLVVIMVKLETVQDENMSIFSMEGRKHPLTKKKITPFRCMCKYAVLVPTKGQDLAMVPLPH